MSEDRLQKIISRAGICSRRHAEELIEKGLVTVNGQVATLGTKADPATDAIKVDGRRVPPPVAMRYLVVHKPPGYMSTVSDPEGRPTVLELVPAGLRKGLVPVGRLDFQTEGLLLLTTDGEWAQRIAHPRYGCRKTYEAKVRGTPDEAAQVKLREGIWIDGKKTRPAEVSYLRSTGRSAENNSWWEVSIGEGKTRQVREMFFRVGHPVQKLRRVAIGNLRDRGLERGSWRELTAQEVDELRRAVPLVPPKRRRPRVRPQGASGPAAGRGDEGGGKTAGSGPDRKRRGETKGGRDGKGRGPARGERRGPGSRGGSKGRAPGGKRGGKGPGRGGGRRS